MQVRRLVSTPMEVNVYVVRDGDAAMIIDASSGLDWDTFGPQVSEAVGDAHVERIYLSHQHVDHVGGVAKMAALTGAPACIHADEADAVEQGDATRTLGAFMGVGQDAHPVTRLREGDVLKLGAREFEVLLVPGHSPAHTALWEPESRSLFSGDVVFSHGSFGRVDFPGCDAAALVASIERLSKLDAKNLYAGHLDPVEGRAAEAILESLDNARTMLL